MRRIGQTLSLTQAAWARRAHRWNAPFTAPVPEPVAHAVIALQIQRLHAFLPMLCLIIIANTVAMGVAVLGDLPWWQQAGPPALITGACLGILAWGRKARIRALDQAAADHQLRHTTLVAAILGLVAGIWSVNAFTETERYYCMVAPVFIGIAALVSATCLISVPRAALAAMITTITPIVLKMAAYDNLGVRAMAATLVLVTAMQAGVVLAKFRETVAMLVLQHEMNRLAATDALTGLDNRLAFMRALEEALAEARPVALVLADLDGFKAANDTHGHLAGDAILIEVARRLRQLVPQALSVARLGGDEFAVLLPAASAAGTEALRAAVALPIVWGESVMGIGASFGVSLAPSEALTPNGLIQLADERLYADKAARRHAKTPQGQAPRGVAMTA